MMLSLPNKFLFVHIQRTGGMTLKGALRRRFPDAHQYISPHAHAKDALKRLGKEVFDSLYRFAIVRNPWDRLVSWYAMLRERDGPGRGVHPGWDRYRYQAVRKPFEEFLQYTEIKLFGRYPFSFAFNQCDYLQDETGKWLAEAYRFEDYQGACSEIGKRLGVSLARLPHRNTCTHGPYRQYYTPQTRDLVAARFQRDILAFGYDF